MKTIVVSGAIANKLHNGGAAWTRLSWILGIRKLGFNVHFIEQIARENCVDANGDAAATVEGSENCRFFQKVVERFGLSGSATLLREDGHEVYGASAKELSDLASAAEVLVNITGHLNYAPVRSRFRRSAYIDLDPGYTQFWHAEGNAGARLVGHDYHFTVGQNIGTPYCPIPTSGIRWRPVLQPVVFEEWPALTATDSAPGRFTTVASWRGPYGRVQHANKVFGLKAHQFRRFIDLPRRVTQRFEIALDIHPDEQADLRLLRDNGWNLIDPREVAGNPDDFQRYVQGSAAEFSVAQGIYVETNSGWFSDRTVRYLASGKPALVQDTGFAKKLLTKEGLIAFRTADEAAIGVAEITRDYRGHCQAARALAETHFDSSKVLGGLLEEMDI